LLKFEWFFLLALLKELFRYIALLEIFSVVNLLPWIPAPPHKGSCTVLVRTLNTIKTRGCVGWALALTLSKNVLGGHKGVSPFGWASGGAICLFIG